MLHVCPLDFSNLYYFLTLCHPYNPAVVGQDLLWQFTLKSWIYMSRYFLVKFQNMFLAATALREPVPIGEEYEKT